MKRIKYFDLVRAFGIILMIMGHVGFGKRFDYWIHAFHMPIFFIISGYFFNAQKSQNWKCNMIKKMKTILLPYFVFGIFHILLYSVMLSYSNTYWKSLFWDNSQGIPIAGALWFLTALFFCELIYSALQKISCESVKIFCICGITIFGFFVNLLPFEFPFSIGASLVGVGLYHIGQLIHCHENNKWLKFAMNMNNQVVLVCVGGDRNINFL